MSNVKIHNFSSDLSTTYPRFGDKLIIMSGKHVNSHITRCAPGADRKKYNKLCPWEKDTEIRRERKNDFRGLDVGEGVYEGKMKNRKKLRQQGRKKGEIGRKKAATGIIL